MRDFVDKLFAWTTLPAFFVGLSSNALESWIPSSFLHWIGWASLAALVLITTGRVILRLLGRIVPRRFANLLYVFDDEMALAVIDHPHHHRIQPPGSRLGYHEAPHEAVSRVVEEELGLRPDQVDICPPTNRTIGKVTIVPRPFQVQVERRKQRLGVKEHYDFVYVCRVKGRRPTLESDVNPRWMSLEELRQAAEDDVEHAPFEDVIPTLELILADCGREA